MISILHIRTGHQSRFPGDGFPDSRESQTAWECELPWISAACSGEAEDVVSSEEMDDVAAIVGVEHPDVRRREVEGGERGQHRLRVPGICK